MDYLDNTDLDPKIQMLIDKKRSYFNYQERRQADWTENYTLSRGKVTINRLTQRQSVSIPLAKLTTKTVIKDVDDMPLVVFEELDNDKEAEILLNEHWKNTLKINNSEVKDIVDKKQDITFGRTFDQWQIADGQVRWSVIDTVDITVDRYVDPTDLDLANGLIHNNIFIPLADLEADETLDKEGVAAIKQFLGTEMGLIKVAQNEQQYIAKQQKMVDMGLIDATDPILGQTYVQITMFFLKERREGDDKKQIYAYMVAEDMKVLLEKPQEEVIGKTRDNYWQDHFIYNSWADDVDMQDFWSDGIIDTIRPLNQVLNAWFSQLVENRTLKNLNMNIYNSNLEGFVPQTWTPRAFGMYGVPIPNGGRLEDAFQQLKVQDLSESLDEMEFLIGMAEKASGANSTQQGVQTEKKITLGEVELALGEAKERIKGMSKYYIPVWHKRAEKYLKLLEAAPEKLDSITVHKKGRLTDKIYTKEISPKDYVTKAGYQFKVWSQDEKSSRDTQSLEKWNAVKGNMPYNPKVDEIYKRKLLEFADAKPDEVQEIMDVETQMNQAMMSGLSGQSATPGVPTQPGNVPPQPPAPMMQAPMG